MLYKCLAIISRHFCRFFFIFLYNLKSLGDVEKLAIKIDHTIHKFKKTVFRFNLRKRHTFIAINHGFNNRHKDFNDNIQYNGEVSVKYCWGGKNIILF